MTSARNSRPINDWVELAPFVMRRARARRCIRTLARRVAAVRHTPATKMIESIRDVTLEEAKRERSDCARELVFCVNVLCDLLSQGWRLKIRKNRLYTRPPSAIDSDPIEEKARVR